MTGRVAVLPSDDHWTGPLSGLSLTRMVVLAAFMGWLKSRATLPLGVMPLVPSCTAAPSIRTLLTVGAGSVLKVMAALTRPPPEASWALLRLAR